MKADSFPRGFKEPPESNLSGPRRRDQCYKGSLTKERNSNYHPGFRGSDQSDQFLRIPGDCCANQPQIAKGMITFEELQNIMNKMKTLLGREGAYVNDIYFCPHHPDKGFPGEIPELKIKCDCRKPAPGMLKKAAEKYNIDLSASWMVGDMTLDIGCGKNAGCRTALVRTGEGGRDGKVENAVPDIVCDDLLDAVKTILGTEK